MALRGRNKLVDEHFFFISTTIINFIKIFTTDRYCDILIDNIKHYQKRYEFEILAYCIMPSHFHWIINTNTLKGNVSAIMRDIKKYSSWEILEQLRADQSPLLMKFQTKSLPGQKYQFWMHRFDDLVIRNQKMLWNEIRYIHNNPVKAGIVNRPEDYKYSSARNYLFDDHSVLVVEKSWAGIEIMR